MTTAALRDWRDSVRTEIEEIDADLIGALEELREVRERIAGLRARKAERVETLRFVRGHLASAK